MRQVLRGTGLHTGMPCRVVLVAEPGPVTFVHYGVRAALVELRVVSTARATTVETGDHRLRVGTVEHLLAALAGLGIREGLVVHFRGPELPLLDGGALAWCAAAVKLQLSGSSPRLWVTRKATYDVGPSQYELAPGDGVDVSVRVELDRRFELNARWRGDPRDFALRIAPARTFALFREVEELERRGLARHVDPGSVLVIAQDEVYFSGRSWSPDEPARHKLLDLLGDLYLHGGPPLGRVHAVRPGHASNARAFRRALDEGILAPL